MFHLTMHLFHSGCFKGLFWAQSYYMLMICLILFILLILFSLLMIPQPCLSIKSLNDLFIITNSAFIEIENWYKDNKLALNYKKTLYVVLSQRNIISINDYKLTLSNNVLTRSDNAKFLGLFIDNKLN